MEGIKKWGERSKISRRLASSEENLIEVVPGPLGWYPGSKPSGMPRTYIDPETGDWISVGCFGATRRRHPPVYY